MGVWMLSLPCLCLCSTEQTELSTRLWKHWKLYLVLVFFVGRVCMVVFFLWLQSTAFIHRGVSSSLLESTTEITRFQRPWTKVGHPECGICLADYEPNDAIRTPPCSHHFHV